MKNNPSIKLSGSFKPAPAHIEKQPINKDEFIEITIRLRRKNALTLNENAETLTHAAYQERFSAGQDDINAVESFAHENHLTTIEASAAKRIVKLKGRIKDFEAAFEVDLFSAKDKNGQVFRARTGDIHIPTNLESIIEGVFGFDDRPAARPMFQIAKKDNRIISHAAAPQAFTADQLAKVYGFPAGFTGKGQTIAIIELGGGFKTTDITNYFKSLNIPKPTVKAISVDGGANSPSNPNGADGEVMLDIEVAGAVAPGATLAVYFAPNTDQGFLDAILNAVHDTQNKPAIISISWGAAEVNWTQQSLTNFNDAFMSAASLGITICVAAGDSGSSDGVTDGKVHVDFPSSSPYVLACGGTKLVVNGNNIASETVWHASSSSSTGGGVSDHFPLPDYQKSAGVPLSLDTKFKGRGVPDVAADADPDTGYKVLVDGQQMVIGGTSAVAPLMAGLIARINEQQKKPAGFVNPQIYTNPGICRDIVSGDNKTTSTNKGYDAKPGWDACTGWGVLSKLNTALA
ncbi:MAG: family peptidase [Mucilaginibacter sp.]|nr:family peptidase [Mucilaginibacter sp.]